jgi:restriction endonuclease Mrr
MTTIGQKERKTQQCGRVVPRPAWGLVSRQLERSGEHPDNDKRVLGYGQRFAKPINKKIILVDGTRLTELMVEHNIGLFAFRVHALI